MLPAWIIIRPPSFCISAAPTGAVIAVPSANGATVRPAWTR